MRCAPLLPGGADGAGRTEHGAHRLAEALKMLDREREALRDRLEAQTIVNANLRLRVSRGPAEAAERIEAARRDERDAVVDEIASLELSQIFIRTYAGRSSCTRASASFHSASSPRSAPRSRLGGPAVRAPGLKFR